MHDLDRTQNLFEADSYETEFNFEEEGDFESEYGYETDSPFNEVEEMELAAQLLEITDEAELDQFLGSLIKKAGKAVGKFVKSGVGRSIGGLLKGAAMQALPMVGGALGNLIVPGVGGAIGSQLGSSIGGAFGMELEGLSPQDQEFEVAKRFVRFAGSATKKAVQAPPHVPPRHAAKKAVISAARKHAPGLIKVGAKPVAGRGQCNCPQAQATQYSAGGQDDYASGQQQGAGGQYQSAQPSGAGGGSPLGSSGRWIRQNGQIILLGA